MIKMADTCKPLGQFAVVEAEDVSVEIDGETKMLQTAIDNGEIGGGSGSWNGTRAEFEALDKSTLKDGQQLNFTDDYNKSVINDSETSGVSTWSSQKIGDELGEIEEKVKEIFTASYTLLWKNSFPYATTFEAQSIIIENIKNHNLFVIVWKNDIFEDQAVVIPEYRFTMNSLANSSNYNCYRAGKIDKVNKTLNFQRGMAYGQYNDTMSIPLALYGIKQM